MKPIVVAISGASGSLYAVRLIEVLRIAARRAIRSGDSEILRACASRLAKHGDAEMGCDGDRDRLRDAARWLQHTQDM